MSENLWDVEALATYLKINRQTVYNMISKKKLPYLRVGGVYRFQKETIDQWLDSQKGRKAR